MDERTYAAAAPYRMRYGPAAFIGGWLVSYVVFCLLVAVVAMVAEAVSGQPGGMGLYIVPIVLMFGFLPALVVGVPLGLLTAWPPSCCPPPQQQ